MYHYERIIRLADTDAAGVVFFGSLFGIVHEAYESFMSECGCDLKDVIQSAPYSLPIVHAEADFRHPITLGEQVTVALRVEKIGNSSFSLAYELSSAAATAIATAKTVHVAIDKQTDASIPLPEPLRQALS